MKKFQKIMVLEAAELKLRIKKLSSFMKKNSFFELDVSEKIQIEQQLYFMKKYYDILIERIDNFKYEPELLEFELSELFLINK